MSSAFAYLGQWNEKTGRPALDQEWLDDAVARAAYEERSRGFDVVPADVRIAVETANTSRTPWVLHSWPGGVAAFRSTFFTPAGSIFRIIDWKDEGDRIFKWSVVEYSYPDDDKGYRQDQNIMLVRGNFNTDGTGTLTINDKSKPTVDRLSMDQVDVSGNWLDRPAFGEWGPLIDPDFGTMPGAPA